MVTELLLVRHGQAQGPVPQWWVDLPLSEVGRSEAKALALRFDQRDHIAALYSSPLKRAYETARIIGVQLGLKAKVCPDLTEVGLRLIGGLAGFLLARMIEGSRLRGAAPDALLRWPHSKRTGEFVTRVGRALDAIASQHDGQRVIVVSHAGTIRACLAYYFPSDADRWWEMSIRRCTLTRLQLGGAAPVLLQLDDEPCL